MEGGVLVLRNFLYLTIELRGRCLIDAAFVSQATLADCFQYTKYTGRIDIGRELGRVEADLYVALGRLVVYLIGLHLVHHLHYRHGVAQVGIMQVTMRLTLQMGNTLAEVHTTAADDAVNFVSFL